MSKSKKDIQLEKKKGLSDAELIAKYEAGKQPVGKIVMALLDKPSPNAPKKVVKRP